MAGNNIENRNIGRQDSEKGSGMLSESGIKESSATVFGKSSEAYVNFSKGTIGYRVSEKAILEAMKSHFTEETSSVEILEVGAGTGQSTMRVSRVLDGLTKYNLISTEPRASMIEAGRNANKASLDSPVAIIPQIQTPAEDLSFFPDEKFNIVYGSQVVHWIDDLGKAFSEAYRVLKPNGKLIHAGSGIIKGEKVLDENHFTRHKSYIHFLNNVEEELIKRGIWNPLWGKFEPVNPLVSPTFHRYEASQVEGELIKAGFVNVSRTYHRAPINAEEMDFRMQAGNVSMFIFGGKFAVGLEDQERAGIVDRARNKLNNEHPELLKELNEHPVEDSTILFAAIKPR